MEKTSVQSGVRQAKISDAQAYFDNDLKSFLILQVPESENFEPYETLANELASLSDEVQVVTNWDQIEKVIYENQSFPGSSMEDNLRRMVEQLKPTDDSGGEMK